METHFNTNLSAYRSSTLRPQSVPGAGQPDRAAGEVALASFGVKSTRSQAYTFGGSLQSLNGEGGTLLDSYRQIRVTVQEQLAALTDKFEGLSDPGRPDSVDGNPNLELAGPPSDSLNNLTEYWSVENTARRIFAIALLGYHEGLDKTEFAEKAISLVTQAYADVRSTLGFDFPQLVLDTKQTVLDALEQFRNGSSTSEISF